MIKKVLYSGLILLSILATIKICILGLGIDEEYAVTMSYRMADGDVMFQEMWEPHQTSGFLNAVLIRMYLFMTGGSTDYLILYLRLCGCLFQLGISVFLYKTAVRSFSRDVCFIAAVFFYNSLPKWIQSPEFSNMLIWFSVLTFLCFWRYYFPVKPKGSKRGSFGWLIGAGICVSCLVLSYPSCILAVPVFLLCMWKLRQRRGDTVRKLYLRETGIFLGICVILGLVYISFFVYILSLQDFLYGVSQMMRDGSHDSGFFPKLIAWGQELVSLFPYILIAVLPGILLSCCFRRLKGLNQCLTLILSISLAEQVVVWLGNSRYLQNPLIYFYLLYLTGVLVYWYYFTDKGGNHIPQEMNVFLFWMGTVMGGAVWFSALLVTNTTISVTGSYLMIGLLSALFLLDKSFSIEPERSDKKVLWTRILLAIGLVGTTLLVKGFFVCSTEGLKDTVGMVRQKGLYGPAKGIYCRYIDGFVLNNYAELLEQMGIRQKKILFVGVHSLIYLYGEQEICNYSTISTPTYDERLWEYWERNPDRLPELVICDASGHELDQISRLVCLGDLMEKKTILENASEVRIYEVLREATEEMISEKKIVQ